jgi:putative ABC transport system substrate-binding protein
MIQPSYRITMLFSRDIRRRDVLLGAAVAVVGWRAVAQEAPKSVRIGFIVTGDAYPRRDFDEAMRRLGWVEGRNLIVERRMTGEDPERRKTAAAELIAANPDVIGGRARPDNPALDPRPRRRGD